jgi:hypothetical protein
MNQVSQRLAIQRLLAQGHALTPLSALRRVGTLSLSQRIGELKGEGWDIQSERVKRNGKWVCRYWLEV